VSARNNCTICVCEKQLYNLCLRETTVQSVSARNNCTICVCEEQLYNLCLRETAVQSVSTRNNCTMCPRETTTICVCEKRLYKLCLRETTVQCVSARNSCTICLRETAVQCVSARNNCTTCVCEKHLYNLCLRETTLQCVREKQLYDLCLRETAVNFCLRETTVHCVHCTVVCGYMLYNYFVCRIQCVPYSSWHRLSLYDANVRFCKSHHEYGRWYKWSFMHSVERHWRTRSGHCHSPRYQLFGPITIPDLVPSTNPHPVRESVGQPSASSWSGVNSFSGSPARADRVKICTLNRIDWLSASEWLGFGLKGLICASD